MELTTQYYHDFAVISCKYCSCKYRCFGASNCSLCLCGLLNMILTRFYKVFFFRGAFKQLTTPNQSWTWICKENLGYKAWKTPNNTWSFFPFGFMEKKISVCFFIHMLSFTNFFLLIWFGNEVKNFFFDKTKENRKPITWTECKTE